MTYQTAVAGTQGSFANISIRNGRLSCKRINGRRTVYMENGTEFQIELNNNENSSILAKIKIDGKYISNTGLVLRPGEHVYLERFFDSSEKFLFETYDVDDVEEVRNAIKNNGVVSVKFYKEEYKDWYNITWKPSYPSYPPHHIVDPWIYKDNMSPMYYNDHRGTAGSLGVVTSDTVITSAMPTTSTKGITYTHTSNKIETGRVEKGSYSNQQFTTVNKQFQSFSFKTDIIYILPKSRMASEMRDYCYKCGKRLKRSDSFCSKCGTRK